MATCLVTGGAGFLGSHLCDELLRRGHRVICVDNLETGSLHNIEHIRVPEFDFRQYDIIEPYFVDEPVDFVYHLASPASPIDYLRLPLHTLKVGSHGTHHTLGLAKKHRARFLIASTSEVYGDPKVHPQQEDYWGHVNPIGPRGVYDEAKRYAEALTMAYHKQQGVDTAIMRIFNSIPGDEQVVYDNGRELVREPVTALATRMANRAVLAGYAPALVGGAQAFAGGTLPAHEYPLEGYAVPSMDADGRAIIGDPIALVAHPTNEKIYEVQTRYGRSVKVTGHHSLFTEGDDGRPVKKAAEDLVPGDRVAVARRIEVPERDRRLVSMLEVWTRYEGDPWAIDVAWDGLGEELWARRHDLVGALLARRDDSGEAARRSVWGTVVRWRRQDRAPLGALRRAGLAPREDARVGLHSAGKAATMPLHVEITDELLWLLGLWVAEGCWIEENSAHPPGTINIACEEEVLDRAEAIVREQLGLHVVRVAAGEKRAGCIVVNSSLLLVLLDFLGFGDAGKRIPGWILGLPLARLKWFIEGYREGDGVHSGEKLDGIRHEFSTVDEELKDDLIVAFARFGLVPSVGRYETTAPSGERRPSWRLTLAHVAPWRPLEWDEDVVQVLNARVTADVVWASVTEITEVEDSPLVYDFSVPGPEVFLGGTGFWCANTYGSRMRAHDGRAIPTFMRQALQDRPITVFGDGRQTRSFCYVTDLIDGMIRLQESSEHFPVNIGNPNEFTLLELAETVIEVTGSKSDIVFEALPTDDPKQRRPDITRAKELLGWEPQVSLKEGLQRTLDEAGRVALIGVAG